MADLYGPDLRYTNQAAGKLQDDVAARMREYNNDVHALVCWAADLNAAIEALSIMLRHQGVKQSTIDIAIVDARRS